MAPWASRSRSAGTVILGLLLALSASAAELGDRVGIIHGGEAGDVRLTIARESLAPGSSIVIVTMPDGAVLCCAVVGVAHVPPVDAFDPIYLDDEGKTTYVLDTTGLGTEAVTGFGVIATAIADGGRPDIDGDGRPETFRSCASGEGLHMTVWSGEPLASARLWHAYVYLGYDTEPDCTPQDYE